MTIAKRLYLLVAVAFLGLACVTGLALVQTGRVFTAANFANENTTPSLVLLDKVARAFARVRIYTWQYISVEDPALSPKVLANLEASREEVLTLLGDYEKRDLVDAKDTALLKEDRDAVEAYYVVNRQVADLIGQGKREEGRIYAGQHLDESARVAKALDAHNDYNAQLSARAAEEARAIMDRARWQEGAISLLMTAIVAAIGIVLARRVARSLNEAATIARTVAEGDLRGTIDAGGKDEIGQLMRALRDMRDGLVKIVGQVRQGTDTILSASEEIA
ncbi:MAG: MCP four helix bundle domain-containing protein, partial [Burkholderiaceae bacterium]|nr:MCP four helix bundle domain-containing protein [Burkholderiaceae bacterium]